MQSLKRALAGVASAAVVVTGAAVITAAPATAANTGTLRFVSNTGTPGSLTDFYTSGTCSNGSDNVYVSVSGPGFSGANGSGNIVGAGGPVASGSGLKIAAEQLWSDFASTNSVIYNGRYTVTAVCTVSGDQFIGHVNWTNPSTVNNTSATYVGEIPTSVSVSTSTPTVTYGSNATVSATVTATDGSANPTAGSVDFKEGSTVLATAASPAAAAAGVTISGLAAGAHNITAVYNGVSATGYQAATSAATTTVTVSAASTTTSLAVKNNSGTVITTAGQGDTIKLVATVSQAGNVAFTYDNGSGPQSLGTVASSAGTATVTWNIPGNQTIGTYSFKAVLTPTNSNYATSNSTVSGFALTAPTNPTQSDTINVTLPQGTLSISAPWTTTLTLNTDATTGRIVPAALSADGKYFIATGPLGDVTVTDTRPGDLGWYAQIVSSDFTSSNAVTTKAYQQTKIAADNLGFSGAVTTTAVAPTTSVNSGVTVNGGLADPTKLVPVATPILQAASGTGATGFGAPRVFTDAIGGTGIGSATGVVQLGGTLKLQIPTVTAAGDYSASVTVTILSH